MANEGEINPIFFDDKMACVRFDTCVRAESSSSKEVVGEVGGW